MAHLPDDGSKAQSICATQSHAHGLIKAQVNSVHESLKFFHASFATSLAPLISIYQASLLCLRVTLPVSTMPIAKEDWKSEMNRRKTDPRN